MYPDDGFSPPDIGNLSIADAQRALNDAVGVPPERGSGDPYYGPEQEREPSPWDTDGGISVIDRPAPVFAGWEGPGASWADTSIYDIPGVSEDLGPNPNDLSSDTVHGYRYTDQNGNVVDQHELGNGDIVEVISAADGQYVSTTVYKTDGTVLSESIDINGNPTTTVITSSGIETNLLGVFLGDQGIAGSEYLDPVTLQIHAVASPGAGSSNDDVFILGALSFGPPTPYRPEWEGVGIIGHSDSGFYAGAIGATGNAIGTGDTYAAELEGTEYSTEQESQNIVLREGAIGVLGVGLGKGRWYTNDAEGSYYYVSGSILGEHLALGFGYADELDDGSTNPFRKLRKK